MKYDFGEASLNFKRYGQDTPPIYDLANIKRRIYLIVGSDDKLGNIEDCKVL